MNHTLKSYDKLTERVKACIRMNVPEVQSVANTLFEKSVVVDYREHKWRTVTKFFNPDGNLCAFKDSEKFEPN